MTRPSHLLVAALVASLAGCQGLITGGGQPAGPDPDEPRGVCDGDDTDVPGPRLLRRLTTAELTASVRDVLGLTEADWRGPSLPSDAAAQNGFTNNVDRLVVDDAYAQGLLATAREIAGVVSEPLHLQRLLPCSAAGDQSCAQTFLDTYGRRLFRRPLTGEERQRYLELHARVTADADFAAWVYWATVGLLQSPHFVYRAELGEPDGDGYRLTGYEIATALAYTLTGRPPGDELLDMAARGELATPAGIEAAAHGLALDPITGEVRPELRGVFLRFTEQWLGLSALGNVQKSAAGFPGFSSEVPAAMKRETEAFLSHVVFEQRGGIADLLTAPVTFLDGALASYYGYGLAGPGEPVAVERPDGWGIGLLAQGSLLAINAGNTHTSPTLRGLVVRERLLCHEVPPPPAVVGDIPEPTGQETTRERYEDIHAANPACAGCHALMDPIGFAFEHLDAGGRYRQTEGGLPIDDSGYLRGLGEDIPFRGPEELAIALAARPEVSACVATYMASYAYGLDHHDTSCLVTSLSQALERGEVGLLDYYIRLSQTTHFLRRTD